MPSFACPIIGAFVRPARVLLRILLDFIRLVRFRQTRAKYGLNISQLRLLVPYNRGDCLLLSTLTPIFKQKCGVLTEGQSRVPSQNQVHNVRSSLNGTCIGCNKFPTWQP
jgi:hypothetical protein